MTPACLGKSNMRKPDLRPWTRNAQEELIWGRFMRQYEAARKCREDFLAANPPRKVAIVLKSVQSITTPERLKELEDMLR
jgi:hypothetical protein